MALTTLAYMKAALGVSGSALDPQLQAYLDAADRAVKTYCQLELEAASYTEYHTGANQPRLALRQVPVTSVTSVRLHQSGYFGAGPDAFGADAELAEGVDYAVDWSPGGGVSKSGVLFRIGTVWPMLHRVAQLGRVGVDLGPAWGNVRVTYAAGYDPVPADLQMVVVAVAQMMRRAVPLGGLPLAKERIGDYSYEVASRAIAGSTPEAGTVRATLAAYKQIGW